MDSSLYRRPLYQRLNVIVITIPPLRNRREDVEALIEKTLATWNPNYQEHKYLSSESKRLLERYTWPGNVRELLNAIRSAAAIAPHDEILPEYLPDDIRTSGNFVDTASRGIEIERPSAGSSSANSPQNVSSPNDVSVSDLPPEGIDVRAKLLQIEWEYFSRALSLANGNREAAARLLGLTGHIFRKALKERFSTYMEAEGWEVE